MRTFILFLSLILSSNFLYAQDDTILGKWQFDSLQDEGELGEKEREMANKFFADMTLSLDNNNYSFLMMGQSETGTWSTVKDELRELHSSKGVKQEVVIKDLGDNRIVFILRGKGMILKRLDDSTNIVLDESALDKVQGVSITKDNLIGKWFYNGAIKDGIESNLIFKHVDDENVNWNFNTDGTLTIHTPLEVVLNNNWILDVDKQTILIDGEEMKESRKVVKYNENELHFYNPINDSIIKFKKAEY